MIAVASMACGTGKTFTSLRIAERLVNDGESILFAAPSIALVSQARREWLRHTRRKLKCVVVCSDPTAGGRNENEDIGISELECPVTTDPSEIADQFKRGNNTKTVFCTYQSLDKVIAAQALHGMPEFTLAIADEAHRTTGAIRSDGEQGRTRRVDYQAFHDQSRLRAHKRLYMTATPRIYTQSSKSRLAERGVEVTDMSDQGVYGPELHRLPFKDAVKEKMLSDYRVIVLGVEQASVTPGLRRRLEQIHQEPQTRAKPGRPPTSREITRVLGVSLALNGITRGKALERPGPLRRALAFANSIPRSNWFADSLMDSQVLAYTTRQKRSGRALKLVAHHLDASSSALKRNQELRQLRDAGQNDDECRVLCNVKLFTEGVDVPQLDAVAFLEPRDSQVDVVQAVGRVMRKSPGKRLGYIIIPVVIQPGDDLVESLAKGSEGYQGVGRVLRALQAHDGRLAEDPARFVKIYKAKDRPEPDGTREGGDPYRTDGLDGVSGELDLAVAGEGIYAHIAAASGLGRPGQLVADEISEAVLRASKTMQNEQLEEAIADALDLVTADDGGARGVCTIAALMLCNACLLQRRLRDEPEMKTIMRLDKIAGASNPGEILAIAWEAILEKDYAPVFRPALAVLTALPQGESIHGAIRGIAECANRVADSLSELGYDHAGPLYHRILGSARSDGAFYTNNLSAIMLARLAFPEDSMDWTDTDAVTGLRVMDPACGTGTLLMAVLRTIKDRVGAAKPLTAEQQNDLHRSLVEDVLCGLDINQHGVQLAACNLTLGAPTVDYQRMNLVTMPHGPQSDGSVRAGSLEILTAQDSMNDLRQLTAPRRDFGSLDAEQVDGNELVRFPLHDLDAVIMNAPFTANENRGRKYGDTGRKAMQEHELDIQRKVESRDRAAGGMITSNSIRTYFSPLADMLLNEKEGVLAKVIPTTACTGTSGVPERRFLAERFHVESVITSHDPKHPNFSENTSIHESLLICRRKSSKNSDRPTRFHSLHKMPRTRDEAIELVDAISKGSGGESWATIHEQPEHLVRNGDWRPCQFLDPRLFAAAAALENMDGLIPLGSRYPLGPAGQRIRDAFKPIDEEGDGYRVFWSRAKDLRTTMEAAPEQSVMDKKPRLAERYRGQAGFLLLAAKFNTRSGKLLAMCSNQPSLGSMWVPVSESHLEWDEAKSLCAWFNSTLGVLGFLMSRGSTLANPSFSQAELATLPIPDFRKLDSISLLNAYERTKDSQMSPWKDAREDKARDILDHAASNTIGVGFAETKHWRKLISLEPTISGKKVFDR